MKVAFCIPNMIVGGVESVFIRTLDGILERIANDKKYKNIEICVITHAKITEPLYKNWFNKHPKIKIIVLYPLENYFEGLIKITEFFPLRQIRKISFSLYKKFKRLGIKRKIQDVDVFIDYKNCSFWKELRSINKRKIAWIHGNVAYLSNIGVDKYIDDYDKIIGLTDDFVTDFNEKFPNLKDKVVHIYNPLDKNAILQMSKTGPYIDGKYFCHVSRLDDVQKDLRTLLLAFENFYLNNEKPDIKLVIIGSGPKEKEIKKIANSLSCRKNIVFTGKLENPFGYMKHAMANVLSSKIEGLPTVLVESMALGVLCVASNCKYGPREILLNGSAGLLFDVGNVKQLSKIFTDIYKNKVDKDNMIDCATESLYRFESKVINKQIMDLL